MTIFLKQFLLLCVVAGIAFLICCGFNCCMNRMQMDSHDKLHAQLALTAQQEQQLQLVERQFMVNKTLLEATIRAENAKLGELVIQDKRYSDDISSVVGKIHAAQGSLQQLTLKHLFDMQQVLDPSQASKLNQMAADALINQP